jgi:hypothetical protein
MEARAQQVAPESIANKGFEQLRQVAKLLNPLRCNGFRGNLANLATHSIGGQVAWE